MGYLLLCVMVVFLLCVLWAPTTLVLLRVKRLEKSLFIKCIAVIFPIQLVVGVSLIVIADFIGLLNPGGYILAITILTSGAGVAAALRWPDRTIVPLNRTRKSGAPIG